MEYNIYIKLTNGCNLQCKHCYNEIMNNHNSMSSDTLNNVISWLHNFRNNHQNDIINISLHGGEPLLYDLDKILFLINSCQSLNLKWCLTTNLIYKLSDKHMQIFNLMKPYDNNPFILTSYDFGDLRFNNPIQLNLWMNNVHYLMNNNITVQPIICLSNYLINNVSPEDVINFIDRFNFKYFNFERITDTGRAVINKIKPNNADLNKWLLNMFIIYQNRNDLFVPLFENVKHSFNGVFLGCRERNCMNKVITINPDGKLSACPNMADKSYGNLDEIDYCKKQCLIDFEKTINPKCLVCNYYDKCNGDCCQLNWDDTGCPGMYDIYDYINKNGI